MLLVYAVGSVDSLLHAVLVLSFFLSFTFEINIEQQIDRIDVKFNAIIYFNFFLFVRAWASVSVCRYVFY